VVDHTAADEPATGPAGSPDGALLEQLTAVVGAGAVSAGDVTADEAHDEALTVAPVAPLAVVRPSRRDEVAAVVRLAARHRVPIVARGSGTGLSGGAVPVPGCLLVSFERMHRIVDIDVDNHVAVVEPGVTLHQLDEALAPLGLMYPVYPGEQSASIGGNVATNAGGMRAIRYGVTRNQVLGLELVLGTGEVVRTGGRFVKSSTGYDLTQLVIGSEGTLALVTEATLRLHPRPRLASTVLAPFPRLDDVTAAVPRILGSSLVPSVLEYLDAIAMGGVTAAAGLDLGIADELRAQAAAYLVVLLQADDERRLEEDTATLAALLEEIGALDVFVLPPKAADELIVARERAFFAAKAAHADDIVDVVVPRAAMARYLHEVADLASAHGALVTGCGHVGDGNVHLSVFQPDEERRKALLSAMFRAGMECGGAVSGEHGIGTEKKPYYAALEDPAKLALMRGIKDVFDPAGILGPGRIFDR